MTGLINSTLVELAHPSRPTVQASLFVDDADPAVRVAVLETEVARLQETLRESEAAWDALCDYVTTLERHRAQLHQELAQWRARAEMASRVNALCCFGQVRR